MLLQIEEAKNSNLILTEKEKEDNRAFCSKTQKALLSSTDRQLALSYLEERGIDDTLVKKFNIGWCPEKAKFTTQRKYLEQLRGRIIFPIKNEYGEIIAFSGRNYFDKENSPKWWHNAYLKSFFFYGLDISYENIINKDYAIIVEGQIDAIMCHKIGLDNTVASMGTAFTQQHLMKILRFTNRLVFVFDGDSAGRRSIESIKEQIDGSVEKKIDGWNTRSISDKIKFFDVNLNFKNIAYDPDSFIKKYGSERFIKGIEKTIGKRKSL